MMDYFYILLALGMVALCFKGPQWCIAGLGFILPVSKRIPSPPIPLLNAQNLIVLVALAVLLAKRRETGRGAGVRFVLPLLGFLLLATIGFVNTLSFFVPTRYFAMWDPYAILILYKSLVTCLLIYALGCMVARSREDVEIVFKGLMLGVAFEGAFVCLEVLTHGPARANGHLFEGNNAGTYLAGAVGMALATFLVLGWKSKEGVFSLGSTLAAGVGLIFTLSRGNWLAGIMSTCSVALVRDRRALILIIVLLMSHQVWLPEKAMDRIDKSFITAANEPDRYKFREGSSEEVAAVGGLQSHLISGGEEEGEDEGPAARFDSSSQIRLYVWNAGLRMIRDYPLGVGYGVFPFYIGYYSDVVKFRAAHNSYLLIACELGIPGLAILLVFLGCLLFESWMVYLKVDDHLMRGVGLAALGGGIAMMTSAFFYNHFFLIEVNGQQWLLLGLATQVRGVMKAALPAKPEIGPATTETVPLYRMVR